MQKQRHYQSITELKRVRLSPALGIILFSLILLAPLRCQQSQPSQPVKPPSAQPAQSAPSSLPPLQLDGSAALHHLNQIISWYRHSTTGIQSVGLPSDAIYQDNNQSLGAEAVRLAFQSARAESDLFSVQQKSAGSEPTETTQQQNGDENVGPNLAAEFPDHRIELANRESVCV